MTQPWRPLLLAAITSVLVATSLADDKNDSYTPISEVQPSPFTDKIDSRFKKASSTSIIKNNQTERLEAKPSATNQTTHLPITQPQPQAMFKAKQSPFSTKQSPFPTKQSPFSTKQSPFSGTPKTQNNSEQQQSSSNMSNIGLQEPYYGKPEPHYENEEHIKSTVIDVLELLNIIHIPFILITNGAVMIIIYRIEVLHTPYNCIVFGLAFVDFLSLIDIIFFLIDYLFDHSLMRGSEIACVFTLSLPTFVSQSSLSMLLLLCIDRAMSTSFPFWHRSHMSIPRSVLKVALVIVFEFMFSFVMLGIIIHYDDMPFVKEHCDPEFIPEWYYLDFFLVKNSMDTFWILCLSFYVFRKALHTIDAKSQELTKPGCLPHWALEDEETIEQIRVTQKQKIKTMIYLILLFFLFKLPETIEVYLTTEIDDKEFTHIYDVAAKLFRRCNASLNAFVYALSKPIFKVAFKFMLSNRPRVWKDINRHSIRHSRRYIKKCILEEAQKVTNLQWPTAEQLNLSTIKENIFLRDSFESTKSRNE